MAASKASGILLLYHRPLFQKGASTITENIESFGQYATLPVYGVNTEVGFPKSLLAYKFEIIVLHYSLFGRGNEYELSNEFYSYLMTCADSCKIAFFQDEYRHCQKRFAFINEYSIDTVYTCVEPQYHHLVYGKYTQAKHIFTYIPGYVSKDLPGIAARFLLSEDQRTIDIGYRARRLDYYMGREAQEKHLIGLEFQRRCAKEKLQLGLDINVEESGRLYGDHWYRFMAQCKGILGVESGVSIFDLHDEVRMACSQLIGQNPSITFDEVFEKVLYKWENNVPLRTVSPRHFEAAAFRTCQILFEGNYSGTMKPNVHYIPLKKDFSNFDWVIRQFQDKEVRESLTKNAYRDLIDSEAYSYRVFMETFNTHLKELGFSQTHQPEGLQLNKRLRRDERMLKFKFLAGKIARKIS